MMIEVKITSWFIIILWKKLAIYGVMSESLSSLPAPNESDEHTHRKMSMPKRDFDERRCSSIVIEWYVRDDRQTKPYSLWSQWSNDLNRTETSSDDEDQRRVATSDLGKRVIRWSMQLDEAEDQSIAHRRDPLEHRDNRSERTDPERVLPMDILQAIGNSSWSKLAFYSRTREVEQRVAERANVRCHGFENRGGRAETPLGLNGSHRKRVRRKTIITLGHCWTPGYWKMILSIVTEMSLDLNEPTASLPILIR